MLLALHRNGLTYKRIRKLTGFHLNTISRQTSFLDSKGLLQINQKRSGSLRGKKWVNVIKLKDLPTEGVAVFFEELAERLGVCTNDLFVD